MDPFRVYTMYSALKKHFTDWGYDYHRYNGKIRLKRESYEKRHDKYYFEKLERHRDPFGKILWNVVENPNVWIGDIQSQEGEDVYLRNRSVIESLTRVFEREISTLPRQFSENLVGSPPLIIKAWMGKRISTQTMGLFIDVTGTGAWLKKEFSSHPILNPLIIRACRVGKFIEYDRNKAKEIILQNFHENA